MTNEPRKLNDRPHELIVTWDGSFDDSPIYTLMCPYEALGKDRPCAPVDCPYHAEDADDNCVDGRDCQSEWDECPEGNPDCTEEHPCEGAKRRDVCWAVEWQYHAVPEGMSAASPITVTIPVRVFYDEGLVVEQW